MCVCSGNQIYKEDEEEENEIDSHIAISTNAVEEATKTALTLTSSATCTLSHLQVATVAVHGVIIIVVAVVAAVVVVVVS